MPQVQVRTLLLREKGVPEASLTHGAAWKTPISRYMKPMLSGSDEPAIPMHIIEDVPPPYTAVSNAIRVKVGVAARWRQSEKPSRDLLNGSCHQKIASD